MTDSRSLGGVFIVHNLDCPEDIGVEKICRYSLAMVVEVKVSVVNTSVE